MEGTKVFDHTTEAKSVRKEEYWPHYTTSHLYPEAIYGSFKYFFP